MAPRSSALTSCWHAAVFSMLYVNDLNLGRHKSLKIALSEPHCGKQRKSTLFLVNQEFPPRSFEWNFACIVLPDQVAPKKNPKTFVVKIVNFMAPSFRFWPCPFRLHRRRNLPIFGTGIAPAHWGLRVF